MSAVPRRRRSLMVTVATVALVVTLVAAATERRVLAAEPDAWWGRDKALHFSFSAVIAGGGYGATALVTEQRRWRLLGGIAAGLAAGAGKEGLDATGSGDPSWRDFTWDVVGTATGAAVALAIDWLLHR